MVWRVYKRWGAWDEINGKSSFNHKGLYIAYTKAYNNKGISNYTSNWSGTGILMAGVENGIIEYCQAYENGSENGCTTGGPVGIWLANAKNCIIQHCESYNNKAGKSYDGGGFDIDGGSQECIMQYNYSHDNEGAGFALFEWGNNIPFVKNVIRYNISQNDGRKNGYGGLTFWATDSDHKLIDCEVYNNTIYVSKENLHIWHTFSNKVHWNKHAKPQNKKQCFLHNRGRQYASYRLYF